MPYSSIDPAIREGFAEYQQEYDAAERVLKEHEITTREGLTAPALNEFRYAGQHVARALATADNTQKAVDCMKEAVKHIRRAEYDAYDSIAQFYLDRCACFKEDYRFIPISPTIPTYPGDCTRIAEIQDEISREDRNQKEAYIAGKSGQSADLKQIYRRWDALRDELNKVVLSTRKSDAHRIWALIVALLGLAAAIASLAF